MHRIFMRLQISKQELAERKSKSEIKSIRKEQQNQINCETQKLRLDSRVILSGCTT